MLQVINEFQREYRWLSNFWPCPKGVTWEGITYPTSEHAYVAAKTLDLAQRQKIKAMPSPGAAKRAGRSMRIRDDWNHVRLVCMKQIVSAKFQQNPALLLKLLQTADATLIEGNAWGDIFWGVCKGVGQNHLGRILMEVRAELFALTLKEGRNVQS